MQSSHRLSHLFSLPARRVLFALLLISGLCGRHGSAIGQEQRAGTNASPAAAAAKKPAATAKEIGAQVKEAVESGVKPSKRLTLTINGKEKNLINMQDSVLPAKPAVAARASTAAAVAAPVATVSIQVAPGAIPNPAASRQALRARAAASVGHTAADASAGNIGDVHWAYEGENGPQAWGRLKPEFNICAIGKRQSPIIIEESATLRGPAEPIQFGYPASSGSVVNNGHTIQVDVVGDNSITVRGSTYKLLQFHFHHPSEEQINDRSFAMVAHLVHRNNEGQLAVVAVLLEAGDANPLIHKVWTYMPLDAGDRVRLPDGTLTMAELLPKDQRYYQFIGSLTTPPCSEGVLWLVLKQTVTISREQLRLFGQLFPNNARPVQALNGRAVRDAQ
ncbi:MAG: carbonic anhydrase family protein [Rhodoferax sp.]|nr:carbonic anhydrase family protein [Rhodoferax sp.]